MYNCVPTRVRVSVTPCLDARVFVLAVGRYLNVSLCDANYKWERKYPNNRFDEYDRNETVNCVGPSMQAMLGLRCAQNAI